MSVSADLILSSISAALFGALFLQFAFRFARSRWWIYFFCALFTTIRIAGYGLRAFMASDSAPVYPTTAWINYYIAETTLMSVGAIFILLILARLYQCILPKLRYRDDQEARTLFEKTLVDHTRVFLLPVIGCIIAGAVLASYTEDAKMMNTSLILRKVSMFGLFAVSLIFLAAAISYRRRYTEQSRAFTICVATTTFFVLSMIYKIVSTFNESALNSLPAFYLCSTLLELIALAALCGDLQTYFLGQKKDELPKGIEFK
ncbi:hypothetical protein EMPS_11252 [Entomortierella parvispora]|uniref:Uncharacterized protein n=1 Tax=Entomortierella parvispora TaxID=205924 RepID=A0A9P3M224_9FUNG|nr:hypothetical protein EMPS_11252 [Entomortierella parvispora]